MPSKRSGPGMHEFAVAQSIRESAASAAGPGRRVAIAVVEMGPLRGVVPDALERRFSIVVKHKGMKGARIDLGVMTASARCPACRATFLTDSMRAACAKCGDAPVTVDGEAGLMAKRLEIKEVQDVRRLQL